MGLRLVRETKSVHQVPYIRYQWPGKEFDVGYTQEELPGNQEAIQEMRSRSMPKSWRIGFTRRRSRNGGAREWKSGNDGQSRSKQILEAMRLRVAARYITDMQGPRVQLKEQALCQRIVQIEEDER
jgi:hypothetical protein